MVKYLICPKKKYEFGYCLVCAGNCRNDCGKQDVCQLDLSKEQNKKEENKMKYIKKPASKYVLGFCNVCTENCHNDCGQQKGCGYCASYTS